MIEIKGLAKTFRVHQKEPGLKGSVRALFRRKWIEKHALRGVDFNVSEGEIVGLVGANGAGKTTLVKIAAGIIHPSGGSVRVLGHVPFARENEFRRQIALIMGQKAQLWWDLPASDCFLLLREIYQVPKKAFDERLAFLAATLGVEAHLKVQVRRLSLGERMKMELIAALLHEPRVVFLDEPTIGLDLTAQKAIRKFLLEYRAVRRPAMILTSHYMEDIERLCERIVILREGGVVYDGPLRDVAGLARHKIVTARLSGASAAVSAMKPGDDAARHFAGLGAGRSEVLEATEDTLKIKARQEEAPAVAAALLTQLTGASLAVVDLNIEREDIGTVIEAMIRGGAVGARA